MENSHTCDICDANVHRVAFAKHLRSKEHLEDTKYEEMIIPEWLFREPNKNVNYIPMRIYNPSSLEKKSNK